MNTQTDEHGPDARDGIDPTSEAQHGHAARHLPTPDRPPVRFLGPVVRASSFVRKELVEIMRQPRMLVLLVLGPFILLGLFGVGYSQSDLVVRTVFVGVPEQLYGEVIQRYEEDLDDFIDPQGLVGSEAEALRMLADGDTQVVVVFPDDPVGTVLGGERAVIRVLHDEIDPLAESAIWIMAQVATQELNATVLSTLASRTRDELGPDDDLLATVSVLADELASGDRDAVEVDRARQEAIDELDELLAQLEESGTLLGLVGDDESDQFTSATAALAEIRSGLQSGDPAELRQLGEDLQAGLDLYRQVLLVDPAILTRPFDSTTRSVLPTEIRPEVYFVPAALALLLQHMGVTFAALSLVRDRSTGLVELLRVGPLTAWEIIIGKIVAFFIITGAVAALLIAGAYFGLGVPIVGAIGNLAIVSAGVILASLSLGMVLSVLSGTESQAVQFGMLSLLATLFFSGFVLPVEDLSPPVRIISYLLPVTYGIRALHEVMFRGTLPETIDILALFGLAIVYGSIAAAAFRSHLKAE